MAKRIWKVVVGGLVFSLVASSLGMAAENYFLENLAWHSKAELSEPAGGSAGGAIGGKIYDIGGFYAGADLPAPYYSVMLMKVKIYDPETNTWASEDMDHTSISSAYTVFNEKIYTFGGATWLNCETLELEANNWSFSYDASASPWTFLAPLPEALAGAGAAAAYDADGSTNIYVMGGTNYNLCAPSAGHVYAYNIESNEWTAVKDMPVAVNNAAVGTINNRIYVVGGLVGTVRYDNTQCYDPITNTWSIKSGPEAPRSFAGHAVLKTPNADGTESEKLFILGGNTVADYSDYMAALLAPTLSVEAYDPVTDEWTTCADLYGVARSMNLAIPLGGKIYTMGGLAKCLEAEPNYEDIFKRNVECSNMPPFPPELIDIAISESVPFTWKYSDPDGDAQKGIKFELSEEETFSSIYKRFEKTISAESGSEATWETPQLPAGDWYWRMAVQDDYGAWSEYSSPRLITGSLVEEIGVKLHFGRGLFNPDVEPVTISCTYIEGAPRPRGMKITIYNLFGELVKKLPDTEELETEWDGRNGQGEVVSSGGYYYLAKVELASGEEEIHKGKFGVLR